MNEESLGDAKKEWIWVGNDVTVRFDHYDLEMIHNDYKNEDY